MASSVPSAVSAFISIATAALPANVFVWFGKTLGAYNAPVTLQVMGVHTGDQTIMTMGPDYKREETYEIQCMLTSWAGDADYASRMTEVFSTFQLITVAVGNNPTLNNTVRFAEIKTFDFLPDATAAGTSMGNLIFNVACQQRISSLT